MKSINKESLKTDKEANNCVVERTILEKLKSDFVVKLHFAFQTPEKIYFVVDYLQGGDLFFHLQKNRRFSENKTKFYIAQCVLALKDMHSRGIIYRDLKLENIMLDCDGNIKITDFGLSKLGIEKNKLVYSFVGTPEYLSPEVVKGTGYDTTTDWWSLGVIMFEMLAGRSPFYNKNHEIILDNILVSDIPFSKINSKKARNLLLRLLDRNKQTRIGSVNDAFDIMEDPFFEDIKWNKLRQKAIDPPFKPKCKTDYCSKYFSNQYLKENPNDSIIMTEATLKEKEEYYFEDFTYLNGGDSSENEINKAEFELKPQQILNSADIAFENLKCYEDIKN